MLPHASHSFRRACCLGVLPVLLLLLAGVAFAQGVAQRAPLNPDFLQYQQTRTLARGVTPAGNGLGYVPSPVDMSYLKGKALSIARAVSSFPSSYDLRTLGRVTPIKNQDSLNMCWAFASIASLESSLMPGEQDDFSEMNMANTAGFDLTSNEGGDQQMAAAYLTRWSGAVSEASDPFTGALKASPANLPPQKHVQDVAFVPGRASALDNDNIKQAVMTYGAMYAGMFWSNAYYNGVTASYYYNGAIAGNHAIAIIGWDDNYSSAHFNTPPPGNGAFLAKDSWGTLFGQSGYFYISYYDTVIGQYNALFYNAQPTTNYAHIYQYDPLGLCAKVGYGSQTAWFANVFTTTSSESVAAASWYSASPSSTYTLYVYATPTNGPINSSGPVVTQSGSIALPGYHTVAIAKPPTLAAGQRFSVVVQLTTPGYSYPVPMQEPIGGYSSAATSSAGHGYMSTNGTSWSDLTSQYPNSSVCLKAFSNPASAASTPPPSQVAPRPDLSIRTASQTTYSGVGVYNPTNGVQTLSQPTTVGTAAVYMIMVQNSGTTTGQFSISGTAGVSGWSVHYFNDVVGGTDITSQVENGSNGGWTVSLAAQAETAFRVEVTPTAATSTTCEVDVYAWTQGNQALLDGVRTITSVSASVSAPLSAVNLRTNYASPQPPNTAVLFTAVPTGGSQVQYSFQISNGSGTWTTVQNYGTANTYSWKPIITGIFYIRVLATQTSGTATASASATVSFTISFVTAALAGTSLSGVNMLVGSTSPQRVGSVVMLMATPIGGSNPRYRFRVGYHAGSTIKWSDLTGYASTPVCSWRPTTAGLYTVTVLVREATSPLTYQYYKSVTFTAR